MGVKYNHEPSLVMADYGPKWRLFRRMGHAALKVYGRNQLQSIICTEVDDLCRRLESFEGRPLVVNRQIGMSLTNVICTQIFGSKYNINDSEFVRVYQLNETITNTKVVRCIVDVFPFLKYFIKMNNMDEEISSSDIERFNLLRRKYEQHKVNFDKNNIKDYTDALLKAKYEAEEEDAGNKQYLTDHNITSSLTSMFTAGSETTATTLCWSIIFLLHYPEIQRRLHKEIDSHIREDDAPNLSHKKDLPFLEAFTSEVLRMNYVTPLSIPHKTTADTSLKGYYIPKDTMVVVNLWSLHHDQSIWKDPFEFNPARFLDEQGMYVLPPGGDFLPFSAGPRGCMGEVLARSELFLFLSRLLQRFEFKMPAGSKPPSLKGVGAGTIIHPPSYQLIAKKR
ncbi:hypothetical protein QZH41_003750 [Actinostola sp. cb2023]|nr:hypothetical protein QZH41_003750 [Actinostola sp. cb2023]